jgi:hypothetical protein
MDDLLFDASRLNRLAFEAGFGVDPRTALVTLEKLLSRRADGTLAALCETRVEQSFNERLFSEVFGYQTLLRSGMGSYHLEPKSRHASGRYDDFSLGFYGPSGGTPLVSCELKSPGADLDAPQPAYHGVTPVQQAMRAVTETPSVKWVLLSNFDEVRLYRAGDPGRYHAVRLSDLLTPWDMERALAVLSREALLGDGSRRAPLERFYLGEVPNMLDRRDGSVRLIHEMRPLPPLRSELRLHNLDDALQVGLKWAPGIGWRDSLTPLLRGDRLVAEVTGRGSTGLFRMVEMTTSGVLRVSDYVSASPRGVPHEIDATAVALSIATFLHFATGTQSRLQEVRGWEVTWTLLDAEQSSCFVPDEWSSIKELKDVPHEFAMTGGVAQTRAPPSPLDVGRLVDLGMEAVREILYPYEGRSEVDVQFQPESVQGRVARICPPRERIEELLKASGGPPAVIASAR